MHCFAIVLLTHASILIKRLILVELEFLIVVLSVALRRCYSTGAKP
jgi:hypothetical protein